MVRTRCAPSGGGVRCIVHNSSRRAHPVRADALRPRVSGARGGRPYPAHWLYDPPVGQTPAQKAVMAARGQQPKKRPGKAQREAIRQAQAAKKAVGGSRPRRRPQRRRRYRCRAARSGPRTRAPARPASRTTARARSSPRRGELATPGLRAPPDVGSRAGVRTEQGQDRQRGDVPLPQAVGLAARGLGLQHPPRPLTEALWRRGESPNTWCRGRRVLLSRAFLRDRHAGLMGSDMMGRVQQRRSGRPTMADPAPDTEPSPPSPEPGSGASPGRSLFGWQTVIAALIAAMATVIGTLLAAGGSTSSASAESPGSTLLNREPRISIDSWTETPGERSTTTYVFTGTATDLIPGITEIHVVIQSPVTPLPASAGLAGAKWLVSPKAEVLQDNRWKVTWTLSRRPPSGRWVAVLTGPPPNNAVCLRRCTGPALQWEGPNARGVRASAAVEVSG